MGIFKVFVLAMAMVGVVYGQQFSTEPQHLTVLLHDQVTITCGITGDDSRRPIMWYFGSTQPDAVLKLLSFDGNIMMWTSILAIDTQSVDGARTRTLHINRAGREQEGEYICQLTGDEGLSQVNSLVVNVRPSLTMQPDVEELEMRRGETKRVSCTAAGKPTPTITWSRVTPESVFPEGVYVEDGELVLENMGARHGGVYECSADNGAGDPVSRVLPVNVRYAPNVTVEEEFIHTGPGDDVSIICSFLASPEVEIQWLQNGNPISRSSRTNLIFGVDTEEYVSRYLLRITDVQPADLGTYQCIGRNSEGDATAEVKLSAHPHSLTVNSRKRGRYSDQYRLKWSVVSKPHISHFDMQLEELNMTHTWLLGNETLPGSAAGAESRHRHSYILSDLHANATYSIRMRANNSFGVSEWLEFTFHTAEEGNPAPSPTTLPPSTQAVAETHHPDDPAVTTASTTEEDQLDDQSTSAANQIVASLISIAILLLVL